ncbi:MAG: SdiA-regulated family protein [Bacteroidota bacterium]
MKEIKYFFVAAMLFLVASCKQPVTIQSPPGYDLSKPEVFKMPAVLNEISGIAFKNGNADTLYAVQDEKGELFHQDSGDDRILSTKFGKNGDYEDLSIWKDNAVVLRSDGTFFTFPLTYSDKKTGLNVSEFKDLVPAGEYESMYADEKNNTVYVLCKDCSGNKKDKIVNGYTLKIDTAGQLATDAEFSISEEEIEKLSGIKKIRLKAAAMAKNSLTGEWYIVSAVNNLLLITDANWKVKNTYPLLPASVFTQPEGIAFDSKGNLYIANEGGGIGGATVLKFAYQSK